MKKRREKEKKGEEWSDGEKRREQGGRLRKGTRSRPFFFGRCTLPPRPACLPAERRESAPQRRSVMERWGAKKLNRTPPIWTPGSIHVLYSPSIPPLPLLLLLLLDPCLSFVPLSFLAGEWAARAQAAVGHQVTRAKSMSGLAISSSWSPSFLPSSFLSLFSFTSPPLFFHQLKGIHPTSLLSACSYLGKMSGLGSLYSAPLAGHSHRSLPWHLALLQTTVSLCVHLQKNEQELTAIEQIEED